MSLPYSEMYPVFLGSGAGFYPEAGNTSAYFLTCGHLFLIDCGETVFSELKKRGILDGISDITVVISHLHSDHCGSLSSLIIYCRYALNIPVSLCVPDDASYRKQLKTLLELMGCSNDLYRFINESALHNFGPYNSLHYIPTEHVPCLICYSFILDSPAGSLFYSADTCSFSSFQYYLENYSNITGIFFDVTDADYPGNVHVCLSKVAAAIPSELRDRTYFMHLNSQKCAEKCIAMGFHTVSQLSLEISG